MPSVRSSINGIYKAIGYSIEAAVADVIDNSIAAKASEIRIDEYMEMMFESPKEMEEIVTRLARLARAAGIHLVLSTQRATSNVITSAIKANIPCRASFTMVDARETKTITDRTGTERLLGEGDMLFSASDASGSSHIQTAYVSYKEIDDVIDYVRK